MGIDISPQVIVLAKRSLHHNRTEGHIQHAKHQVEFLKDDIFHPQQAASWADEEWDIVISNPPYISPQGYARTTARSVRNFEPKSALVPPENYTNRAEDDATIGDSFYPRILKIAEQTRAKMMLVEVADMAQAERVVAMVVKEGRWSECEIWRDWPGQGGPEVRSLGEREVRVRGEGNGRAVFACRSDVCNV